MPLYHGSPVGGLTELTPSRPRYFDKPARVCMTGLREMALFYLIDHFEYAYGFDREGRLCYDEYFPGALEELYRGRPGWIYTCADGDYEAAKIPYERVSPHPVAVCSAEYIPDALEGLLEAERAGRLILRRYEQLTPEMLAWIMEQQRRDIREKGLLGADTPLARYIRTHYPEAWALERANSGGA